ncbi:MAG: hypothetical protein ABI432_11205 [Flavobacteriales bacterium]
MRRLHHIVATLLSIVLLWMNGAVHTAPPVGSPAERERLHDQLRYLQQRAHTGLGDEMQRLFPEGCDFTHALYGLAWCGLARSSAADDPVRQEALREALWALAQFDRADVQARFSNEAKPMFGVFHAGWRNMLLGRIIEAQGPERDPILLGEFQRRSAEIAEAFANSPSPYLESYPGQAWPADAVVAMASLGSFDRLVGPVHRPVMARWLAQVYKRVDRRSLIPHAWDPLNDRVAQDAQGSSQALMNAFLPMIDSTLAAHQYMWYRMWFLVEPMGLPVLREYPHGTRGPGDVDSGPVIFGVGGAATLVNIAATRANEQPIQAHVADAVTEALCFGAGGDHRRYLIGAMPIADLFIAWGRSVPPAHPAHPGTGFKQFHVWSMALLLVVWSPVAWRRWKRRNG